MRVIYSIALLCLGLTVMAATGCKSQAQQEEEALWREQTPLPLDPTEPVEMSSWWSNGQQLLHLHADNSYELFPTMNRYNLDRERGRWARPSYAYITLEPYNRRHETVRVQLDKIDGRVALRVRKLGPMFPLDAPPSAKEDRLVGTWKGSGGTLRLNANMRYSMGTTVTGSEPRPLVAGHRGSWVIESDAIVLKPDSPVLKPMRYEMTQSGDAIELEGPTGALSLIDVDPAAE